MHLIPQEKILKIFRIFGCITMLGVHDRLSGEIYWPIRQIHLGVSEYY
jgi:hypothetical protein